MCAVSCEMTDQLFLLAQCIHILHQQIVESFGCQQCNVKIPAHKRAVGNYIYVLTHTHTHTYTHTHTHTHTHTRCKEPERALNILNFIANVAF